MHVYFIIFWKVRSWFLKSFFTSLWFFKWNKKNEYAESFNSSKKIYIFNICFIKREWVLATYKFKNDWRVCSKNNISRKISVHWYPIVCVSPLECRNGNKEFPYYEDTASFVFLWNYDTVISSGINHPGMAVLPWE